MTTTAIERLNEEARDRLTAHFLALPSNDRGLRFGTALAPEAIAAYVDRIDFCQDTVFGAHDDRRVLIGAAHVAFDSDFAEVGLSVLPAHRYRGLGGALFQRAAAHARNRRIPRLVMHFLRSNAPIMRIARRFRMRIVANAYEADAQLDLGPASIASIAGEFVMDASPLYDRVWTACVAASHRRRAATPAS